MIAKSAWVSVVFSAGFLFLGTKGCKGKACSLLCGGNSAPNPSQNLQLNAGLNLNPSPSPVRSQNLNLEVAPNPGPKPSPCQCHNNPRSSRIQAINPSGSLTDIVANWRNAVNNGIFANGLFQPNIQSRLRASMNDKFSKRKDNPSNLHGARCSEEYLRCLQNRQNYRNNNRDDCVRSCFSDFDVL